MPEVGPQSVDPKSGTVSRPQSVDPKSGTVSQSAASRADAREISISMTTSTTPSTLLRPVPEVPVHVGVVVSVASKRYEIGEKLGRGAGGSVYRASPRREAADIGGRLGQGGGPDS
eukprot:903843-Amphidinium_carterae.1